MKFRILVACYTLALVSNISYLLYNDHKDFHRKLTEIESPFTTKPCTNDKDCYPNAICIEEDDNEKFCRCKTCKFNDNNNINDICTISRMVILLPFLISLFIGVLGVDHCLISGCSCPGVCLGILKFLTAGGFAIWWILDVIFIGAGTFNEMYNIKGYQTICNEWI